jgi:hypothetical protein
MSRDEEDDFISFVVLIPCIIAFHRPYTNFSSSTLVTLRLGWSVPPRLTTRKRGGGGETFEITKAASPAIMSETRHFSHS